MLVLSLMEKESLAPFLESSLFLKLRKRIADGEMEGLFQEDIENVRDIMSKEVNQSSWGKNTRVRVS